LDAAGRPHISYFDVVLMSAYFDGVSWLIEPVDSTWVGYPTSLSLALDGADRPHISYLPGRGGLHLDYASFDGTSWQTETVNSAGEGGLYSSLALDSEGRPHISSYDWLESDLIYTTECLPITGASIAGPAVLPAGQTGLYTATYTPITATIPSITWDNGAMGPTALYRWAQPGTYTVTVTIRNACGEAQGVQFVEASPYLLFLPVACKPDCVPRK
jgi:hypothetical protein